MGRLIGGYDTVPAWLASSLAPHLRLGAIVSAIDWSPGRATAHVRIHGRTSRITARAAIVTVPISLLHAAARGRGTIAFTPEVPAIRSAAACIAMGQVQRATMLLDRPLFELLGDRRATQLANAAFVMARGTEVPVWWTSYPVRSGLVVGWAGGPNAIALGAEPRTLRARMIASLADTFGLDRRTVNRHVVAMFHHDWSRDVFTRGAYSYVLAGGADAATSLARPVRGTLFFAGEATDPEGRTGTVHGAIATGHRAASQALRSL
jgi:monoamine oxidase